MKTAAVMIVWGIAGELFEIPDKIWFAVLFAITVVETAL